ncbi:hypothetical protein R6Q59_014432 [Mikania micrantha]
MSRNLRDGSESTTDGKSPEKRLLLISSSYRRHSFSNDFGTVPQNMLEFMWNSAKSVSNPRSSGRVPEMFAWLRSIPATVVTCGSSKEGAQNTPV